MHNAKWQLDFIKQGQKMYAGIGKREITPQGPIWMDGMIRSHKSEGVHDPIFTRALLIGNTEDPRDGFAIVSADVCALKTEHANSIRAQVSAATGISVERVVIAATHNHSGPAAIGFYNPAEAGYVEFLSGRIVEAVVQAADRFQRAVLLRGEAEERTVSHYRRLLADDGHVVMNWESFPAERIIKVLGEIDPRVRVLGFRDANHGKSPFAVFFHHAGHPNVMSGDNYLISADYPGASIRHIEEKTGSTAMFINGAQGNIDIDGLRDRDWTGVERAGGAIGEAVLSALAQSDLEPEPAIRGASISYEIPARHITEAEWAWTKKILAETGGKVQPVADGVGDDYKAVLFKKLKEQEDIPILIEQTCIAIGDTALIGFPGELFTEIGANIEKASPFSRTIIIGLANGYAGYIPTQEAIKQGGYETETRTVADNADEIIIERSRELLKQVYELK